MWWRTRGGSAVPRDAEVTADVGDYAPTGRRRTSAVKARVLGVVGGREFGARPTCGERADGRRREVVAAGGAAVGSGFQGAGEDERGRRVTGARSRLRSSLRNR